MTPKDKHIKWLRSKGLAPDQLAILKKKLGSEWIYESKFSRPEGSIPANGTKPVDMSKANFAKANFALVPSYNKGPIQPISKEDLKQGAGRKL